LTGDSPSMSVSIDTKNIHVRFDFESQQTVSALHTLGA